MSHIAREPQAAAPASRALTATLLLLAGACAPPDGPSVAAVDLKVQGRGNVRVSPGPESCERGCLWTGDEGTRTAMVATPAPGWAFTGWSGDCSGQAASATLVLHQIQRCTAVFAPAGDRAATAATAIPWSRTYGSRWTETAAGVARLRGGDLVVAGSTGRSAASFDARLWVARIDRAGAIVWQRSFHNDSGFNHDAIDVVAPASGGLVVLARSVDSFDDDAGAHERGRIWLVRLDDDGQVTWQKRYGHTGNLRPAGLVSAASGGFLVTARSIPDRPTRGALGSVLLLCVDASGAITWRQVVSSASVDLLPGAVLALPDGFLVAANDWQAAGGGTLLRLDAGGAIRWQRSHETRFNSGALTRDGGFLLAGVGGSGTSLEARLARFDARGRVGWHQSLGATDLDVSLWSVTAGARGAFLVAGTGRSIADVGPRPPTASVQALLGRRRDREASDAVLLLIGDDGAIRWQRSIGGPGLNQLSAGVAIEGGFALAGSTGPLSDFDIWTLAVSADGALPAGGQLTSRTPALQMRPLRSAARPASLTMTPWPGEALDAKVGFDDVRLDLRSEAPARPTPR